MTIEVLKRLLEEGVKFPNDDYLDENGFGLLQYTLQNGLRGELAEIWNKQVGEFEIIKQESERLSFDQVTTRYIFKIDGVLYALDTLYDSWDGGNFNPEEFYEVVPVEKTIIVYERKS